MGELSLCRLCQQAAHARLLHQGLNSKQHAHNYVLPASWPLFKAFRLVTYIQKVLRPFIVSLLGSLTCYL